MKRDVFLVVLLVAIGALVVVAVRQRNQIGELKTAQETVPTPVVAARPPAPPQEPAPEPAPVEITPPAPAAAPASSTAESTNNPLSGWASMMKNPAMKEMVRSQQKMMVDRMYSGVSKYLNSPADKQDALRALLLERQMAMVDAGMAMMGGSAADRKQAAEETKALKTDYDKKIQDLLGPQDYETFKQYDETIGERTQVQLFRDSLPASAALTEQQEVDLIAVMYEERKSLPASSLVNNKNPDPSQLTQDSMNQALKQMQELQKRYADRAAAILTPAQLEQFVKWQEQMNAMQAAGMKMAAQMFGNKSAMQPPAATANPTP